MKLIFTCVIASLLVTACHSGGNGKQEEKNIQQTSAPANGVRYQLVTDAIKTPVQMVASPDNSGRLFISDLSGKIYILQNGKLLDHPFIDVSSVLEQKDTAAAMRAIFSMAFHPDFAKNGKFYICYNAPAANNNDKCKLVVSEFSCKQDQHDIAELSSRRTVFEVDGKTVGVDDCQIAFGPDGYLYVAVGDNGTPLEKREAQHLDSYLGKLLRIDVNKLPYGVPADNPFVGRKNIKPEIWSYGLRRLWRFSFDPQTQQLIGGDIGDKMQEEVDIIQKGGNYGWPIKEGDSLAVKNTSADTSAFVSPLHTYPRNVGICIIGGSIYHGTGIEFLKNKYVFADFNGSLFSLTKNQQNQWTRETLQLLNPPADPLTIFSLDKDNNNELFVLGVLNTKTGSKGAVYKLVHS